MPSSFQGQTSSAPHVEREISPDFRAVLRGCIQSSSTMAGTLVACGLASDENFNLWSELHQETCVMADSLAAPANDHLLPKVFGLLLRLKLPHSVKTGLAAEFERSRSKMTRFHAQYFDRETAAAITQPLFDSRPSLFTEFRSPYDVTQQIRLQFRNFSIPREQQREVILIQRTAQNPRTLALPPIVNGVHLLGMHSLKLLSYPFMRELYVLSSDKKEYLQCRFSEVGRRQVQHQLPALLQTLRDLSGENRQRRSAVLAEFGGIFPIQLEPQWRTISAEGWIARSTPFAFRIPYGRLQNTREELEATQREIELGVLHQHTVEIRGRIDVGFLAWISGKEDAGRDPIPDIELVYAMPLPSGTSYRFILKPARSYSSHSNPPLSSFTPDDQQTIRGIGAHFTDPYNRRSLRVLTDPRPEDYPPELYKLFENPDLIETVDEYAQLRVLWNRSQARQVLESLSRSIRIRAHEEYCSKEVRDLDTFRELCRRRLQEIPERQPYYPPEFFRLTPQETESFASSVVPTLFDLYQEERARVDAEKRTGAHAARVALGYDGPEEGYQLPIDHAIMDQIINFRKRDAYRLRRSRELGIPPELVEVPRTIGRHYDQPDRFFTAEHLPQLFESLRHDSRFKRRAVLRLYDPLHPARIIEYPIDQHPSLGRKAAATNWSRMEPSWKEALRQVSGSLKSDESSRSFETFLCSVATSLFSDTSTILDACERASATLARQQRHECTELWNTLTRRNIPEGHRKTAVQNLKEAFEKESRRIEKERSRALDRAMFLCSNYLSSDLLKVGIRIESIIDERIVKCVYGIGADSVPRFGLEVPGGARDARNSHSEILGAKGMYAGGEVLFATHRNVFHTTQRWESFRRDLEARPHAYPWRPLVLDDATGHYQVLATTLPFARAVTFDAFERAGISTSDCAVVDTLARGLQVAGTGVYRF